jgi:hypothetical protein
MFSLFSAKLYIKIRPNNIGVEKSGCEINPCILIFTPNIRFYTIQNANIPFIFTFCDAVISLQQKNEIKNNKI